MMDAYLFGLFLLVLIALVPLALFGAIAGGWQAALTPNCAPPAPSPQNRTSPS
jgi:hypothetical protein